MINLWQIIQYMLNMNERLINISHLFLILFGFLNIGVNWFSQITRVGFPTKRSVVRQIVRTN